LERNYTARHERAAKTREKLIASSIKLVNEHGYNNTTIDDICADCGISKGAFYHHFNSKMDIVTELEAQVGQELSEEVFKDKDASSAQKLQKLLHGLIKGVEESGLEFVRQRSIYNISGAYENGASEGSYGFAIKDITAKIIMQGVESGELKENIPVDDIVETVGILMSGLISSWTIFNGQFSITERCEMLSNLIIPGMLEQFKVK
jgi:TetR/AcrR family transcriptional regulator, fatty acid metabolism regulator protein